MMHSALTSLQRLTSLVEGNPRLVATLRSFHLSIFPSISDAHKPSSVTLAWRCRAFSTTGSVDNHYKTLGLERNASADEIKNAFYIRSKEFHPDVNPGDPKAEERFKAVSEAYNVLSNARSRKDYDLTLSADPFRSTVSGRRYGDTTTYDDNFQNWDEEKMRKEFDDAWRLRREAGASGNNRAGMGSPYKEHLTFKHYRLSHFPRRISFGRVFSLLFLLFFLDGLMRVAAAPDLTSKFQGKGPPR